MNKDTLTNTLWVEKYRPTTIDDIVLPADITQKMRDFGVAQDIPNIILVGTAGIGKTSLARIIVNSLIDCEVLNINASGEGGIDTVRSKVKSFATSASFLGKPKVVIFGEADGLTKSAQDSLKEIIEECSQTTRFIFTANDISKMSKPIVSRCQRFDIDYTFKDFLVRVYGIFKKEDLKGVDGDIVKMCRESFPDFRTAINKLQRYTSGGVFGLPDVSVSDFVNNVWAMVKDGNNPEGVRKFCIENSIEFSTHEELMIKMAEVAFNKFSHDESRVILKLCNNYLVDDRGVMDKELNFYCLIIDLCELIN